MSNRSLIPCNHQHHTNECRWCDLYKSDPYLKSVWDGTPDYRLSKFYDNRSVGSRPGAELKDLLTSLGIRPGDCECLRRMNLMDKWGVTRCKAHREKIIEWLRKEQKKRSWGETLKAASLAVTSGLAFKLNPLDPAPGLLDEAIRRAEAKINNAQGHKPSENSAAGTAEGNHA